MTTAKQSLPTPCTSEAIRQLVTERDLSVRGEMKLLLRTKTPVEPKTEAELVDKADIARKVKKKSLKKVNKKGN